mgnify:CR=1 FL=1
MCTAAGLPSCYDSLQPANESVVGGGAPGPMHDGDGDDPSPRDGEDPSPRETERPPTANPSARFTFQLVLKSAATENGVLLPNVTVRATLRQ